MRIVIVGDLVPTENNCDFFSNGLINDLVDNEIKNLLSTADLVLANLETPLTDEKNPIKKCGPCLSAPESTIRGIKELGIDFFTLANNHIMDQGEKGLAKTIDILDNENIAYAGVGPNLKEMKAFSIMNIQGLNIGIFCCAENEFSLATGNTSGANPFDPLVTLEDISTLKSECDYLIVLYHGGKEHYRYPSPNLAKICRKIAEKGADLVVVQHSHCVGTRENYNETEIVYGQGNFIFSLNHNEFWNNAIMIEILIENGRVEYNYIPIEQNGCGIRMSNDEAILKGFYERSKELDDDILERKYAEYAEHMLAEYEIASLGRISKNIFIRAFNKLMHHKLTHMMFSAKQRLVLIDFLRCDAHRELWIKGLETCINKSKGN